MGQSRSHGLITAIGSTSLLLAACGGDAPANEAAVVESDSNIMLEQIGNDASALEAAGVAAPRAPLDEGAGDSAPGTPPSSDVSPASTGQSGDEPVLGESDGGDTGGNIVQGNVSGL